MVESIWAKTCALPKWGPLEEDLQTQVAVVGGGMAGLLTAYQLQQAGREVAVLEAGSIARGQTGNTTAKVTSQHGLIYRRLLQEMGDEGAHQYAAANEQAIQEYRQIIQRENIPCDWQEVDAFVYGEDLYQLQQEASAACSLGIAADLVTSTPTLELVGAPGAVRFREQGQFHPLKFVQGISRTLTIYENSPVRILKDGSLQAGSHRVQARQVVFACHFPFVNFPGLYFARMHQERSYVLALEGTSPVEGLWIGADSGGYSLRSWGDLVLLGGCGHRTGENRAGGRYEALRSQARRWFPGSREVACWSAQDCMTLDGIPYIGPFAGSTPGWYVATGFQKWGMTHAMASAMILRDLICKGESANAPVFSPERFSVGDVGTLVSEGGQAVKGLGRRIFQIPPESAKDLAPGCGGVVQWNGEKAGVYRDRDGTLYGVDIRCPHLGCQLEWNPDERSWDCPCHGSRFDFRGNLLDNPAQEGLNHG